MLKQRLALSFGLLLASSLAHAAPAITSISGTVGDDQVITITGSGFGTNNMQIEWLGGTTGVIETGNPGGDFRALNRANWTETLNPGRFDTSNVYSGRKSLIFDSSAFGNDGRFGMHYNTGGNFPELYASYAAYIDNRGTTQGQWKMMRYSNINSVTDDATPDILLSNWTGGPGDMYTIFNGDLSGSQDDRSLYVNNSLPPSNGWYRLEAYIRPSSGAGTSDGELWIRTTRLSDGVQVGYSRHTNVMMYTPGETKRYRYVIFQNYQGSGFGENGSRVWMDDLYISQTQARVEVCNASTWAACTNKQIQPPQSWSDNRITVKLNRATLPSLATSYLYVVDGTGAVNANGYLLGIGTRAPNPATDVR